MRSIGYVWSNTAIKNNRTWFFVAEGVMRVGEPHRGPGEEDLELVTVPTSQVPAMIDRGDISHALVVLSLQSWLLGLAAGPRQDRTESKIDTH